MILVLSTTYQYIGKEMHERPTHVVRNKCTICFLKCVQMSCKLCNFLLYFRRTLLPSASSGLTIGRLSLTQLFTSVIGIPISLYHDLGTSSSQRFHGLPLGRRPSGWITSALLWGAVGAILLTCDHHLILFLFAVCSTGCMFTRRLISSSLILSILAFPVAFLRRLISVVVNNCLSLLMSVQFSFW